MNTPTASSIDDLAARATVRTYGDISIISIPDVETLSEFEQIAALKTADILRPRLISGHVDADALRSTIQSITPPPDQEEEDEESRVLEAQARKDLESDGCPACYPPNLDVPVRSPCEEYRAIIEYWQSFSSTGDVVLCAQRSDWQNFRASQLRVRARYRNKSFDTFINEVHKRRRRHRLDGDVHLLLDSQCQSQQQNWIEFQNYHLKRHERLEKERDALKKELNDNQKKVEETHPGGSEHAAQNEIIIQRHLKYAERTLKWQEVFLKWIEGQRVRMSSQPLTSVEDSDNQNVAVRVSLSQRRSRRPDTSTVLDKIRVSKRTPKNRNMQTQTIKASKSKPFIADSNVTASSSTQQLPKRREAKLRRAKERTLNQLRSQRVFKAARFADAGMKSRPGIQRRGAGQTRDRARSQRRNTPQRPYPAPGTVKTRSGRVSRPPVRWSAE